MKIPTMLLRNVDYSKSVKKSPQTLVGSSNFNYENK